MKFETLFWVRWRDEWVEAIIVREASEVDTLVVYPGKSQGQ